MGILKEIEAISTSKVIIRVFPLSKTPVLLTAVDSSKATYDVLKKELSLTVNQSPNEACWRLVYDGTKALALFDSDGTTRTIWELFCGTENDCRKKIEELKLDTAEMVELDV
ncbi:MAG: hypothetical protein M0P69_11185 [Bacteroidales bacterium]|nr:hypothetical protein [Bacteroidales bacterium]